MVIWRRRQYQIGDADPAPLKRARTLGREPTLADHVIGVKSFIIGGAHLMRQHQIFTAVASVMVALSVFFVLRPLKQVQGIQPTHQALSGATCIEPPDTGMIPAEYGCRTP